MKNPLLKKIIVVAVLLVFVSVLMPHISFAQAAGQQAQTPSWYNCVTSAATCAIYYVSYTVNTVIAFLITIAASLVVGVLEINGHVFDSPAVKTGFSVALAIANLGFVLAIIIVALATILQSETYGIKKLLWKLVVMAILVNFGLVLTAPIVGFSDDMSTYFISHMGASDPNFVTTITNAFSPQQFLQGQSNVSFSSTDGFTQALLALAFGTVFEFIMLITLLALAALLLIRYVYLGVLLILLPFAWLLWIFPKFSSQFDKWWNSFIKWTFFPAAALFFIYLALQTAAGTAAGGGYLQNAQISTVQGNPGNATQMLLGNAAVTTNGNISLIQLALDETLLIGLMVGGLFAASSLTGSAGAGVVTAAKTVTKSAAGYVGKQAKKGARAAYQKADKRMNITNNLKQGNIGVLGKIPLVGGIGRRAASLAGRGISNISHNEELVDNAKKKVPKNPEEIRTNLSGSMNTEDQLAHIAKLVEMGELTKDTQVNGKKIEDFLDKNKKNGVLERFGQEKLEKDANKALGSDGDMRDAVRAKDMTALNEATKKFVSTLSKADISKMNVDGVFKENTESSRLLLGNIAQFNPALLPGMLAKAKGSVGESMRSTFKTITDNEERSIGSWRSDPDSVARNTEIGSRLAVLDTRLTTIAADKDMNTGQKADAIDKATDEKKKLQKELDDMQKNYVEKKLNEKYHKDTFDKAIANNVFGLPATGGSTPTPTPTPTPDPH